jgi:ribonuclease Z
VHFAFLGTSGAVPSLRRDSTFIVFVDGEASVLVDCGGSPVQKLLLAGVDPATLARVVITHIHPDHAYGLPSLLQNLLLMKRHAPLPIACREEHVEPLRTVLRAFGLLGRPEMFPVPFEPVPAREAVAIGTTGAFTLLASPNAHGAMPNMAIRVEVAGGPGAVVYSSDTAPCDAVVALARGAHTLIHEATFSERATERFGTHSTATEAGAVAARAGVRRLLLTHIDPAHHGEVEELAREARVHFRGEVEIAEELVPYPL